MKAILFPIGVNAGLLATAVVLAVGCSKAPTPSDSATNTDQLENLRKEISSLKIKLAHAQSINDNLRAELNNIDTGVAESGLSASEILDELMEMKMNSSNRTAARRRVNFLLESLLEQGEAAVPHIREFLNRMQDVDFVVQRSKEEERDEEERWREKQRFRATLNFEQPPSLRIGLIDILKEIGGSSAEAALAQVLSTTGRGFEVAYTAKTLREMMGPDAYRDEAVGAAHDLLTDPIEAPNPNSFDRASRQYLFMVLKMYDDQTFIQTAQTMFINEEGKIDRTVMNYLGEVGRERAVDTIIQALRSGQVEGREMVELAEVAVKSTGMNSPQADQWFREIMTSNEYTMEAKMQTIRSMDDVEDPTVLQARLNLMNSVHYDENDLMGSAHEIYSNRVIRTMSGERKDLYEGEAYSQLHKEYGRLLEQEKRARHEGQSNPGNNQPIVFPSP